MVLLSELAEHVQAPGIPLPDQAEDGREIIGENDETEPAAVDQSRGLEDLIVLGGNSLGAINFICRDGIRVLPRSTFVDLQEFLGDVLNKWIDQTRTRVAETRGDRHCGCG